MENDYLANLDLSEKEKRILNSAIKIFSEKGFSAATTSEIARDAGVAEGTIFRYYKTKKDILRGILIQTIDLLSSRLMLGKVEKILLESGEKDLRTVLKELLRDRLALVDSVFPMARVVITEALFHEDVREAMYNNIFIKAKTIFYSFHGKMVERGMMREDIEPDMLLRSILANMAALILQRKFFSDKLGEKSLDSDLDKMIDVLMFGIIGRD